MLSPKTKRNILRILPFGVIWLIFGLVYSLLEKGILGDLNYYPSTGNPYNFHGNFLVTTLTALLIGLAVGAVEIAYLSNLFAKRSLTRKILYKTGIYLVIMIVFLLLNTVVSNSLELRQSPLHPAVWQNVLAFVPSFAFWSLELYMALIIGMSLFFTEVSENLGQKVLMNFFTGKYHQPKEEERIFMFLDMKSSTAIAEKLGHIRYFEMLRTYYKNLSDPIIQYDGEIYQYVGDEIIVTWPIKRGLADNSCLRCFFSMKQVIHEKTENYLAKYGLVPTFKAGFHLGKVTTGEIGVIKKDITFTGDVLNTTARIQSLCNHHQVEILVSGDLLEKLKHNSWFKTKDLGVHELRGRDKTVTLYTVEPIDQSAGL